MPRLCVNVSQYMPFKKANKKTIKIVAYIVMRHRHLNWASKGLTESDRPVKGRGVGASCMKNLESKFPQLCVQRTAFHDIIRSARRGRLGKALDLHLPHGL